MFESYMAERLRRRWVRLRLYRFPGSVLTDYPHRTGQDIVVHHVHS